MTSDLVRKRRATETIRTFLEKKPNPTLRQVFDLEKEILASEGIYGKLYYDLLKILSTKK